MGTRNFLIEYSNSIRNNHIANWRSSALIYSKTLHIQFKNK